MSHKNLIILSFTALVLTACSHQPEFPPRTPSPDLEPSVSLEKVCDFTTCHGLDVGCSFDTPKACTLEYRLGDFCRQFVTCEAVGNDCQMNVDPNFETCKSCVESCTEVTANNPESAFECEEACRRQFEPAIN